MCNSVILILVLINLKILNWLHRSNRKLSGQLELGPEVASTTHRRRGSIVNFQADSTSRACLDRGRKSRWNKPTRFFMNRKKKSANVSKISSGISRSISSPRKSSKSPYSERKKIRRRWKRLGHKKGNSVVDSLGGSGNKKNFKVKEVGFYKLFWDLEDLENLKDFWKVLQKFIIAIFITHIMRFCDCNGCEKLSFFGNLEYL